MARSKYLISKSAFIKGLQCVKYLYLYKFHYKLRDPIPASRKALFHRGRQVGKLAWKLFPGGEDASPPTPFQYEKSVALTSALIEMKKTVIYEASFAHEQVLCALDILVKKEEKWHAYEVKSSLKITPVYLRDAALQYHIVTSSGFPLHDFFILSINANYVRAGKLEVNKLFKKESVLDQVKDLQPAIKTAIIRQKEVLSGFQIPDIDTGKHCFSPYDCEFIGYCWKGRQHQGIFRIGGMSKEVQCDLFQNHIKHISDIPETLELSREQRIQIQAEKTGKIFMNKAFVSDFLQSLAYPLCLVDFEVCSFAVPPWNGTHPYEQIPFLMSVTVIQRPGGSPSCKHYLTENAKADEREFISVFLKYTEGNGDILTFDQQIEKSVLTDFKTKFPDLSASVLHRINRLKDLRDIFTGNHFYMPAMKGVYNLKSIYLAVRPEKASHKVPINNGLEALQAYEKLIATKDKRQREKIGQALISYCQTDTLAMLAIIDKMQACINDERAP